jgi:ketosteroid isomerase-like protein
MSQKNVEVVRELWDAYSRGDIDRVIALSDPYLVLVTLEEGPLYGPDAVRANYARWMEAWEGSPETTVEELIGVGGHVFVIACFRGRGRTSGVRVEQRL